MSTQKPKGYWTKERVFEESKKYKSRWKFWKGNGSAYNVARKNGWLEKMSWLISPNKLPGYWTKERVFEESKKYSSRNKFSEGSRGAYLAAYKNRWLNEMDWLNDPNKKPNGYWTKERVFEESKKYKSRSDFYKKSGGAYSVAIKNKWLKEMWWLKNLKDLDKDLIDCIYIYKFEKQKTVYVGRTVDRKRRDKDHRTEEKDPIKKFIESNKLEWVEMEIIEDNLTIRQGQEREGYWIEHYRSEGWNLLNSAKAGSIGAIGAGKWHYESCKAEASKYKSRKEFQKNSFTAYNVSRKRGWLDEFFPNKIRVIREQLIN